jgi:sugar O-acyltransferase (sialic acid O-acetyltransferase NeuD family)
VKKIVIIGGGGFGSELFGYIATDIHNGRLHDHIFLGVIDDNPDNELIIKNKDVTYLGKLDDFESCGDEVFLISIGNAKIKFKLFNQLKDKKLNLANYIHSSALVASNAILGEGVIICPNAIVNTGACIGDNVALNVFCSIGHCAFIGAHSVLSPYSAMSGDSSLGERSFMGTRATLFPGISIGCDGIIDTHSAVRKSVGDNMIVSVRGEYLVFENRMNRTRKPNITQK